MKKNILLTCLFVLCEVLLKGCGDGSKAWKEHSTIPISTNVTVTVNVASSTSGTATSKASSATQVVLPVVASHCTLVDRMLERSFYIYGCRIISSSCMPIIGMRLHPRPSQVSKPLMPSTLKRFTQLLIDTWCIASCLPILGELKPCTFNRIGLVSHMENVR